MREAGIARQKLAPSRRKISPPELAAMWGIGVGKILDWIHRGELRAIDVSSKQGGRPRYLIDLADVAAFETARSVQPPMPSARRNRRRRDQRVTEFF